MPQRWQPSADVGALRARAELLAQIRAFCSDRNVLEVETPLLASSGVTDPALEPLTVTAEDGQRFLQTSPEYAMKRLLAAGSGDIYQLGKAFRAGEIGQRHNPEYTLLEWYRLGFDHYQLIREVAELLVATLNIQSWEIWPYRRLFQDVTGVDPMTGSLAALTEVAAAKLGEIPADLDRDETLDLMMGLIVEPSLRDRGVIFVVNYPASQASLAQKLVEQDQTVGARFECYVDGIELANGYFESGDSTELRARFERDNAIRVSRGLAPKPIDERFLAAMSAGLPSCSGVALGVDRLLAAKMSERDIRKLISFDWAAS